MAAGESFSLSKTFGKVAKGFLLIALTEILIFTLVHSNPAWMAVMYAITPPINEVFNATGVTDAGFWLADKLGKGTAQIAADIGGEVVGGGLMPALG